MKCNLLTILVISLFITIFEGCGGCPYSFTGSSVPPHLHTIAIPYADDKSGVGEPGLRETFTQMLIQKFIDDNSLKLSERNTADALLESTITSISDAPAIITSGETVSGRRVTVSVSVTYRDIVKKKIVYEKQFSNTGDYSGGDVKARKDAIDIALKKITEDILLDTISGW